MTGRDGADRSGPLSPEEKAECDRELEEMRLECVARLQKKLDARVRQSIDRSINRSINRSIRLSADYVEVSPEVVKQLRGWNPPPLPPLSGAAAGAAPAGSPARPASRRP